MSAPPDRAARPAARGGAAAPAAPETRPGRTPGEPPVRVSHSPGFAAWLAESGLSLAFTTYQTHRLFLLGVGEGGRLSAFERLFDRPMGLALDGDDLWMATRWHAWRLAGLPAGGHRPGFDRLWVPAEARFTGEVDAHDLGVAAGGRLLFVNTLYSCVAALCDDGSFEPVWQPPWVSRLVPEDRCHLNGLAMADGRLGFVTAVARTDEAGGWRERRRDGGVVVDVASGEAVCAGLSMPHSPRLDEEGRLWLLQSGSGELGYVEGGRFEGVAFLPGYGRGLALVGGHAVVGLSKPRDRTFAGLRLQERLMEEALEPRCGLWVIERASGRLAHWLRLEGVVQELYDVVALPGVRRPMALGVRGGELAQLVRLTDERGARHLHWLPAEAASATTEALPARSPRGRAEAPGAGGALRVLVAPAADLVAALGDATFPPLARQAEARRLGEPLVAAVIGAPPAGAAVAEPQQGGRVAELISLFVAPGSRRRGVGRTLLRALEAELRRQGVREAGAALRDDWPAYEGAVRLLEGAGWSAPVCRALGGRGDARILAAPWVQRRRPLPGGYEVVPWAAVGRAEREIIAERVRRGEVPAALSPLQEPERLEEASSVALRAGGRVAGWMITHRVAPGTVQYTALWVEPALQRRAFAVTLIAEAMSRQHAAGVPRGIFLAEAGNEPMVRFFRRRLAPHLASHWEVKWMRKPL